MVEPLKQEMDFKSPIPQKSLETKYVKTDCQYLIEIKFEKQSVELLFGSQNDLKEEGSSTDQQELE